jgi:CRP/FNR family transcriptional regulator, anaerobic regulatory protein
MKETCQCLHCQNDLCIHKVPIFSSLSKEHLEKIADLILHREYKKGEFLLREGEKSEAITIINGGSVKAFKYTPDGREQILYVFSEGDFFGETNLLTDRTATFNVEALQSVQACSLSKTEFQNILHHYPEIAIKIISELGERMARLENAMQGMGVRNVDNRVGGILLEFAAKYGTADSQGILVQLPLSREGIANYLGVARETLSRKLGQLENDGVIRSVNNKSILILDTKALQEIAG